MRFGIFYEQQLPKTWGPGDEQKLFNEALDQVAFADRLGIDYVWAAEHHFLDEYSHSSASDIFLAAAAARTSRIKIGLGIRQVIANYNHPARSAETIATLDLVSNGRLHVGIGEGATPMELGGFGIPMDQKRAMSLEAAEQIANMLAMDPYPGYEGKSFSMPCRNVLPKPAQKPHPPMWMACTNRETIKVAAQNGLGVLAFNFADPAEAAHWSRIYYDIIKSDACVPLGYAVNPNIAFMTGFSLHEDAREAAVRGQIHFDFFTYSITAMQYANITPGRTNMWETFVAEREAARIDLAKDLDPLHTTAGIGTPENFIEHIRAYEEAGIDQVIFLQQAGRMKHEHICYSLELFAREVLPVFAKNREAREAARWPSLPPYMAAAMKRKKFMRPLDDKEIPVVPANKVKPIERAPAA